MSDYLRPIRRGEYDLVNISLIGRDPITRRTYEECHEAWSAARLKVEGEIEALRWWQIKKRWRVIRQALALRSHLGL